MAKKGEHPSLPSPKTPNQKDLIQAILSKPLVITEGPAGTGKSYCTAAVAAHLLKSKKVSKIIITRPTVPTGRSIGFFPGPQPLDAQILTEKRWVTMGSLKEGDFVIGSSGTPIEVLKVYEKGEKDIYEITTTTGCVAECSLDHYWLTQTWEDHKRGRNGSVKSTEEIMNTLKTKKGRLNHYLPKNSVISFIEQDVTVPAYALGALIGDGSFCGDSVTFASVDPEIVERVSKELSELDMLVTHQPNTIQYCFINKKLTKKVARKIKVVNSKGVETIYDNLTAASIGENLHRATVYHRCMSKNFTNFTYLKRDRTFNNKLKEELYKLGLQGLKGSDKCIPEIYKYNSVQIRLDILRGLMDTDGTCKKNGEATFYTTSNKLAEDVIEIVRSLGGVASKRVRDRTKGKGSVVNGRIVKSTKPEIAVNVNLPKELNPFYLTRKANRYITRKTRESERIQSITKKGVKQTRCISVDSDDHLYVTNDFILTHNTLDEKLAPWVKPITEVLIECLGKGDVECLIKNERIEVVPFETIRGRSFNDCFIILDEAQNATYDEIKAFLTRSGENSKVVINGDVTQSDLDRTSGLEIIVNILLESKELSKYATLIEFTSEDIVRSHLCKLWVQAFDKFEESLVEDLELPEEITK